MIKPLTAFWGLLARSLKWPSRGNRVRKSDLLGVSGQLSKTERFQAV